MLLRLAGSPVAALQVVSLAQDRQVVWTRAQPHLATCGRLLAARVPRSDPTFVCSCGSTLHLSEWLFHDAAAGDAGERPRLRQRVHITRTERLVLEQLVVARQLSRSEGTVRNLVSREVGVDNACKPFRPRSTRALCDLSRNQ
jgi:hypothetical protein